MKRKQMINELAEFVQQLRQDEGSWPGADRILTFLEAQGMQPPPNPTGTFDSTWEDEND